MSRVHDILRTKRGSSTRMWYLKISDGSVYGPVQLSVLCDWAAQSRIAPGNQVSEDRKNWIAAEKLSELKMEWTATLPTGKIYGPFNVLAVSHLFDNGTLPADAVLTNKTAGRTLMVEDMLKEEAGRAHTEEPSGDYLEDQAELTEEETASRLLHEAELQQTIDDLRYRAPEMPPDELLRDVEEEVDNDLREVHVLEKQTQHKEKKLKDGIGRLHSDLDSLKTKLDNAKKQLLKEKKEHERANKDELLKRDELKSQVRLLQDKLAAATIELDQSKRKRAEYKGDDSLIHELEDTCRTTEEGLRQQEKAYIALEKESLAKQEELLAEIKTVMARTNNADSEIQRLRKELHAQASLNVEQEKAGTQKESRFFREARETRTALEASQHELAELRKSHNLLVEQSRIREKELSQRLTQLHDEATASQDVIQKLKAAVPERDAERAAIQSRADAAISDLENTKAELQQIRAHYEPLQEQAKDQFELIDQRTAELTRERTLHHDTKRRLENEVTELQRQLEEIRTRTTGEAARVQTVSTDLAKTKKEMDRLTKEASLREGKLQSELEKLRRGSDITASELESATNELTAERHASENLKRQLHKTQKELERLSKEADNRLATQKESYESELQQETEQELALQNRISHLENELQLKVTLLEQATKRLKDGETLRENLENRFSKQEAEYAEQLVQMNEDSSRLKHEVDALTATLAHTTENLAEQKDECGLLKAQGDGKQSELAERMRQMQAEYRQTSQNADRTNKELTKKTSECQVLERRLTAAAGGMEDLQSQLASLRNQYEPMLKDAQKHEKELMKQIARDGLTKPAGPRKPLSPQPGKLDTTLSGMKNAFSPFPALTRTSVTVLAVLIIAVVAFMLGRRGADKAGDGEPGPQQPAVMNPATVPLHDQRDPGQDMIDEPDDMDFDLPPVTLANGRDDPIPSAGTIEWPRLEIEDARVIQEDNISCTIVFGHGLFSSMTNLSETASDALAGVAVQARPHMSRFNLIIKGHTDSTPVRSKSASLDNYTLAMRRAQIVRDVMVNRHGFPADAVFTVSAGETAPPYSNDTDESRKKNRTVVLKLVPKE